MKAEMDKVIAKKNFGGSPTVFICLLSSVLCLLIAGCGSTPRSAPVIDRAPSSQVPAKPGTKQTDWRPSAYTVKKGDTLYAIALDHGLDYKELAEWNSIDNPNVIAVGRQLRLSAPPQSTASTAAKILPLPQQQAPSQPHAAPPPGNTDALKIHPKAYKLPYSEKAVAELRELTKAVAELRELAAVPQAVAKAAAAPATQAQTPSEKEDDEETVPWAWPVSGKLLSGFSEKAKGVDIGGKLGQPVQASADGKVVYSGSGLRGYGKLIIIKHNKTYLSAYAHNSQVLVKEGQTVAKGQKIAEMGNTDADQVKLHFEIRRLGKPVDPLKHLPG